MATLPVRLRQGIRDLIESPSSDLAVRFKSLKDTLGYPIIFDPEWSMIWETLKSHYPDQSTFIPSITGIVSGWCEAFATWLEAPEAEEDIEKILELLNGHVRLLLELDPKASRPITKWDAERKVFVICLPCDIPVSSSTAQLGFTSDLQTVLTAGYKNTQSIYPNVADDPSAGDPDSWALLGTPEVTATDTKKVITVQAPTALPDISTIERPEELTRRPPYWLFIRKEAKDRVVIEGSHGPTLELIEKYMKKWCRGNTHRADRPPLVQINLQESMFGMGLLHDSLVMETMQGFKAINVTLLLVLAESVLGYTCVGDRPNSGEWQFKRTTAFR